jgi:RecA/RadA recombinase
MRFVDIKNIKNNENEETCIVVIVNIADTVPYAISDPQLEVVNYYDNYAFTSINSLTNIMPTVSINTDQQRYAVGSLTGQVAHTTGGPAGGILGTVSVYDRKGRVVRTVRKGLAEEHRAGGALQAQML